MPDALSLPRSELPEEIKAAITRHHNAVLDAGQYGEIGCMDRVAEARSALTAAILSRLAATEAERDEALREHTDMMWQRRRADERADAALARVERLERVCFDRKAILARVEAMVATGQRIERQGPEHLVILANIIEWEDGEDPTEAGRLAIKDA